MDGTTPEILVEFNLSAEADKVKECFSSSKLIFKQNGDKFIHQLTRSFFQRKSSTLITEGTNEVILSMIIEINKQLNQRTLTVKLFDTEENSFSIPDHTGSTLGLLLSDNMTIELSPSYNLIIDDLYFSENIK